MAIMDQSGGSISKATSNRPNDQQVDQDSHCSAANKANKTVPPSPKQWMEAHPSQVHTAKNYAQGSTGQFLQGIIKEIDGTL